MKKLLIPLMIFTTSAFATNNLTSNEKSEIETLLAESASKLIYLQRDCDQPVDKEKFKELAKLKAFSEGHLSIEGISWERVKEKAHKGYGKLKTEAPLGELCEQFKSDIKDVYPFLK